MRAILTAMALAVIPAMAHAQIDEAVRAALRAGDAVALETALAAGADPDARADEGGATALMYAASNPDPAMVEVLLARGAAIDAADDMGDPAINWAAYYGHTRVVARLLEAGADTSLVGHGNAEQIVMRRGHQSTLAVLLAAKEQAYRQTVLEAAAESAAATGDIEALNRLAAVTDISQARDWAGRPLVQAAARAGRADSLRALHAAGADIDAVDSAGFSALFEAARDGQAEAVAVLIELGADVRRRADTGALSLTPLHQAAIGGDVACVEAIIAAGADLDAQGVTGATPMLWAMYEGQRDAVLHLLDAGADPHVEGPNGLTARAAADMLDWPDVAARMDAQAP